MTWILGHRWILVTHLAHDFTVCQWRVCPLVIWLCKFTFHVSRDLSFAAFQVLTMCTGSCSLFFFFPRELPLSKHHPLAMDVLTPQSKTQIKRAACLPSPHSEASGRDYSGAWKLLASQASQVETLKEPCSATPVSFNAWYNMLGVKFGKSPAGRMAAPEVLTLLIAMGDTLGKEVLVPVLLTGDQFALAVQILLLTDW